MKKLMTLVTLAAVALVMGAPVASAATVLSAGPYVTSASVDGTISLSVTLTKNSSTGATVSTMDFGKLIELTPTTGTLRSSPDSTTGTGSVVAMISANTHGLPYTISTKGSALTSGSNTIPAGACGFAPVYAPEDNLGVAMPAGASLGTPTSWVGATDKPIYTSEAAASIKRVQAHYSITDSAAGGGSGGVPLNQPGGTYTGTVTISVTA